MVHLPRNKKVQLALFLLITALLFFKLNRLPLKFEEPRRALVSIEMITSGDYLIPTINGHVYHNKPPAYNWLLVFLFKTLGYQPWVVRLPTVLSLLAMAFTTFFFFRKRLGEEWALLTSLFLITSADLLFFFSFQGEIDLFYSLIVYWQLLVLIRFFEKEEPWPFFVFSYLLMTLGIFTKGLPSLAFQGISILILVVYYRRINWLFHPANWVGLTVAFVPLILYFYAYSQTQDASLYLGRLLTESSRRTIENSWVTYLRHLLEFPLLVVKITLPWSLLFIFSLKNKPLSIIFGNKWLTYIALVLGSNMLLYWLSPGTRERYLYMFLPLLLIFCAWAAFSETEKMKKVARIVLLFLHGLVALVFLTLPFQSLFQIPYVHLVSISVFGLLVVLAVKIWQQNLTPVFGLILLLLIIRLGFDLTITEIRYQQDFKDQLSAKAKRLTEIAGQNELNYYVPFDTVKAALPFSALELTYHEVERLPYALSFHWTGLTQKILRHQPTLEPGQLYIAQRKHLMGKEIEKLDEFSISKGRDYVVFRKL